MQDFWALSSLIWIDSTILLCWLYRPHGNVKVFVFLWPCVLSVLLNILSNVRPKPWLSWNIISHNSTFVLIYPLYPKCPGYISCFCVCIFIFFVNKLCFCRRNIRRSTATLLSFVDTGSVRSVRKLVIFGNPDVMDQTRFSATDSKLLHSRAFVSSQSTIVCTVGSITSCSFQTQTTQEQESLSVLITEMMNILFVAVMTMKDVDVPKLLNKALKAETLLVLSHHQCPNIRTAVLRMMVAYFTRFVVLPEHCCYSSSFIFVLKKCLFCLLGIFLEELLSKGMKNWQGNLHCVSLLLELRVLSNYKSAFFYWIDRVWKNVHFWFRVENFRKNDVAGNNSNQNTLARF